MRKIYLGLSLILLISLLFGIKAKEVVADESPSSSLTSNTTYDLNSNYFVQKDSDKIVTNPDDFNSREDFIEKGYVLVSKEDGYELYLRKNDLNIAILTPSNFFFYTNPSYYQFDIQAYFVTGTLAEISSTIPTKGTYSTSASGSDTVQTKVSLIDHGFKCSFLYKIMGISYNLYVTLLNGRLLISVPQEEVKEEGYSITTTGFKKDDNGNLIKDENGHYISETITTKYDYLIKSLSFFPYFGSTYSMSDGTWMEGYTFIPDGSGALIRYQNQNEYQANAYYKRVYGEDKGIDDSAKINESNQYLKEESTLTLPIYGVVHGANQHAFLTVITEGDSNAELWSNPYGYNGQKFESTYYRFYLRRSYSIESSTSTTGYISSINATKYSGNIAYSYNFLEGEEASYTGMANYYKENYLKIKDNDFQGSTPLHLEVLHQDYKKGLFGKNYIALTTYQELKDILIRLSGNNVSNFDISMRGAFKGGQFSNKSLKPRISKNLGSKKDFLSLLSYMRDNGYSYSAYLDPIASYTQIKGIAKKVNLSTYTTTSFGQLFSDAYLLKYEGMAERILKYEKIYDNYQISSIALLRVGGELTSYRYKNINYYREDTKAQIEEELKDLTESGFTLGLYGANSYTYSYLSKYYDIYTEPASFTFITDSVPFISLLLSGKVELYSKAINYADDYLLNALRMVEYNIYPSFIIQKAESSNLRYTNYMNLFASEYDRWEDTIILIYEKISAALNMVRGSQMLSHKYLFDGVSLSSFDNGYSIVVNYTDLPINYEGKAVDSKGYLVIKNA